MFSGVPERNVFRRCSLQLRDAFRSDDERNCRARLNSGCAVLAFGRFVPGLCFRLESPAILVFTLHALDHAGKAWPAGKATAVPVTQVFQRM